MKRAFSCADYDTAQLSISKDTRDLITVKAKFTEVYDDLVTILSKIDANEDDEHALCLKNSMLDADIKMMHYISKLIDIHLTESNYKQL